MPTSPTSAPPAVATGRDVARFLFRWLASLPLAVFLIVVLAAVLAAATVLESAQGRECAQWYVYRSHWFIALLGLLGANILACTLSRYPWGKGRRSFLITHAGLLVLLAGAVQTFTGGIDGSLAFEEGQSANAIVLSDRSQFTVMRPSQQDAHGGASGAPPRGGFHNQGAAVFAFRPGPIDWPEGKTLDLGYLGGVGLRVLKFYRHAEVEERWEADESGAGGPALRFSVRGSHGEAPLVGWLSTQLPPMFFGPAKLEIQFAPVDTMVDDFLNSPPAESDKDGILSMHYQGRMVRIPVGPNVGKKTPVGDGGVSVEIVECLPSARLVGTAKWASRGSEPDNPLLELRVHVPGKDKPIRQIAFARRPFLNLDGAHGLDCPVKFWYRHPAVKADSGVEFLYTPNGKVNCRVGVKGKYEPRGVVRKGDEIDTSAHFKLVVEDIFPSARREIVFSPVAAAQGEAEESPAALVEVDVEGATEQVWMKLSDPNYSMRQLDTPGGPVQIAFGYERIPLNFTLKLIDFERGLNPGGMGNASYASRVRLVDRAAGVNDEFKISMNQPLTHGKYVFYQSSFQEQPGGADVSILSVGYDPGRTLKYVGSTLTCIGILLMMFKRLPLGKRSAGGNQPAGAADGRAGRTRPASRRTESDLAEAR